MKMINFSLGQQGRWSEIPCSMTLEDNEDKKTSFASKSLAINRETNGCYKTFYQYALGKSKTHYIATTLISTI